MDKLLRIELSTNLHPNIMKVLCFPAREYFLPLLDASPLWISEFSMMHRYTEISEWVLTCIASKEFHILVLKFFYAVAKDVTIVEIDF
jgi:hypothetical protein